MPDTEVLFQIPVTIQKIAKDSVQFMYNDCVEEVWPLPAGKRKFTDTIWFDTTTNGRLSISPAEDARQYRLTDSLSTDGFQVIADYKTTIRHRPYQGDTYYCYYPMYVVNETPRTKLFIAKDNYVFSLQEAYDTSSYNWCPIESRGFDFCGNGYFGMNVLPGEFVVFLLPKYGGTGSAMIRVRLRVGAVIYVSNSFKATFNHRQFL